MNRAHVPLFLSAFAFAMMMMLNEPFGSLPLMPTIFTDEPVPALEPAQIDSGRPTRQNDKKAMHTTKTKKKMTMGMGDSIARTGTVPTKKPAAPVMSTDPTPSIHEPTTLTTEPTIVPVPTLEPSFDRVGTGPTRKPVKQLAATVPTPSTRVPHTILTTEPTAAPVPALEPSHD